MNLEAILENNYGNYLKKFMDESTSGTTFMIKKIDGRLNPNQCSTGIDYFTYDHNSKALDENDQIVDRFKALIVGNEKDMSDKEKYEDRIKVSFNYVDFTPMIFKRKMIHLRDAENKNDVFQEPLIDRGDLITMTEQIVVQTDN